MDSDIEYAQAAIDMLPGTVEEIAEFFIIHKIKGTPSDAHACPMALWIRRWTGVESAVGAMLVQPNPAKHVPWFEQPRHVNEFIRAFDAGRISL